MTNNRDRPSSAEIKRHLGSVEYPATRNGIIQAAREDDAPKNIIAALHDLPDEEFESSEEIMMAYNQTNENIFEVLTKDHKILNLELDRLVEATAVDIDTQDILDRIRDLLIPHARAEEAVLYNSLRADPKGKDVVAHSYREHLAAETLLGTIRGMEKFGLEWTAAAKKLREAIRHHIDEEEGRVFATARRVFSTEESQQMVPAFVRLKKQANEKGDFKNTLDMVANMMPPRFAEQLRKYTEHRI